MAVFVVVVKLEVMVVIAVGEVAPSTMIDVIFHPVKIKREM